MGSELTQRQIQVLDAIKRAMRDDGRPPSIPELMLELDVASPNGIAKHLHALEAKGCIERGGGARGIRLLGKWADPVTLSEPMPGVEHVPLVGTIAAGSPILAQENVEEIIPMPESMTGSAEGSFFLRVKGESMIEEGIMPGDLVLISKSDTAVNGELVAVLVEDEATVKRFYRRGSNIVLEPANRNYEPIIIDPAKNRCSIIGKVVGLMRSYKRKF